MPEKIPFDTFFVLEYLNPTEKAASTIMTLMKGKEILLYRSTMYLFTSCPFRFNLVI